MSILRGSSTQLYTRHRSLTTVRRQYRIFQLGTGPRHHCCSTCRPHRMQCSQQTVSDCLPEYPCFRVGLRIGHLLDSSTCTLTWSNNPLLSPRFHCTTGRACNHAACTCPAKPQRLESAFAVLACRTREMLTMLGADTQSFEFHLPPDLSRAHVLATLLGLPESQFLGAASTAHCGVSCAAPTRRGKARHNPLVVAHRVPPIPVPA